MNHNPQHIVRYINTTVGIAYNHYLNTEISIKNYELNYRLHARNVFNSFQVAKSKTNSCS